MLVFTMKRTPKSAEKSPKASHVSRVPASKRSKSPSGTTQRLVHSQQSLQEQLAVVDTGLMELLTQRIEILQRAALSESNSNSEALPTLWDLQQQAAVQANKFADEHHLSKSLLVDWVKHTTSFCQHEIRLSQPIAYLGPIYSYSYMAAVKHLGQAATLVPVATIAAVFEELVRGQAAFGVVPIENSTDGRVVDTLGMFARWPVRICGEVLLPIHHCLLGRCPRGEITEVYSKPQALSQCRGWLSQHVPDARLVEVASTAAAARIATEKQGAAAIAGFEAGMHHGLDVIDQNIEDQADNVTRFAVLGNRPSPPSGHDKTSLMFQLKHQPGALADAMVAFQQGKINLTWIESFPLPKHPNEYLFFVELEGHEKNKNVAAAIQKLRSHVVRLEILGSYPRGLV